MGATLSTESVLTAAVLVGAAGFGYHQYTTNPLDTAGRAGSNPPIIKQQSKKKKKGPEEKDNLSSLQTPTPLVGAFNISSTIPGQFDDLPQNFKPKKSKKKKPQHSTTDLNATTSQPPINPPSTSERHTQAFQQQQSPPLSTYTNGSWTRVNSHRKAGNGGEHGTIDVTTTSDAGITSSVTENSSPIDDDEEVTNKRTTLAEKLASKVPKTDVDDMLPDQPPPARVMRVKPLPNEKPPSGFSWDDYDNVYVPDGGENDADGEDDGEWGVVENKRARATTKREGQAQLPPAPTAKTKKQRQNASRREVEKAANAAAEADRLAKLAKHKRELERIRIMEQSRSSKKGSTSGGMTSVVDDRGKLVWE